MENTKIFLLQSKWYIDNFNVNLQLINMLTKQVKQNYIWMAKRLITWVSCHRKQYRGWLYLRCSKFMFVFSWSPEKTDQTLFSTLGLGLHRILIWPDIRQIFLPDIRLNSNIEFFSRKKMYLYWVFNKSAYRSMLYIDIILFVKTIFDFKQFF